MKRIILIWALAFGLGGCVNGTAPTQPGGIDFDLQTGLNDGGLIANVPGQAGWTYMSDDWRADYVRLLGLYGSRLTAQPGSPDEGWNLTAPISCNAGVRTTMKMLRVLDASTKTLPPPLK